MDEYRDLISCLPLETVEYAFAYGSGALQQENEKKEEKMVDFVVVSNDSLRFHTDNLLKNSNHYSLIGGFKKASWVNSLQTKWGARIFYNTQVRVGSRLIKYGVISSEDLKQDLLDWKWLYTAGRLQKPVLNVINPSTAIATDLLENRKSALQAALLLLPDVFTHQELYEKIVGLSYNGDIRLLLKAEDPNKISKIVAGGIDKFQEIYSPLLDNDPRIVFQNAKYLQDASGTAIYHRLHLLPSKPLDVLTKNWNKKHKRQQDCEEVLFGMAHRHDVAETVASSICSIVRRSSIPQTIKNSLSAGFVKSLVYSSAKFAKGFKRV